MVVKELFRNNAETTNISAEKIVFGDAEINSAILDIIIILNYNRNGRERSLGCGKKEAT